MNHGVSETSKFSSLMKEYPNSKSPKNSLITVLSPPKDGPFSMPKTKIKLPIVVQSDYLEVMEYSVQELPS